MIVKFLTADSSLIMNKNVSTDLTIENGVPNKLFDQLLNIFAREKGVKIVSRKIDADQCTCIVCWL